MLSASCCFVKKGPRPTGIRSPEGRGRVRQSWHPATVVEIFAQHCAVVQHGASFWLMSVFMSYLLMYVVRDQGFRAATVQLATSIMPFR